MSTFAFTPGTRIAEKYVVESVLGRGGMAMVVAAVCLESDRRVAIKCLLAEALRRPEIVERFEQEAQAAASMHGEHIVEFIEAGRLPDGAPYMVLEHLEGCDLEGLIEEKGPLPVADAIRFVLEACEAVAEVHAARIVHRDLKPSNLFLANRPQGAPRVKLIDFGISKTELPGRTVTKTSAVMGTPEYMSPEQLADSKRVDHRTDIWSLGVILYELLAGEPPFHGADMAAVIISVLGNRPQPLGSLRSDVHPDLEAVVSRCLSTQPVDRYWDVGELAAALLPHAPLESHANAATAIAMLKAVGPWDVEPPLPSIRAQRRRTLLAITIGVLIACLVATGAALVMRM